MLILTVFHRIRRILTGTRPDKASNNRLEPQVTGTWNPYNQGNSAPKPLRGVYGKRIRAGCGAGLPWSLHPDSALPGDRQKVNFRNNDEFNGGCDQPKAETLRFRQTQSPTLSNIPPQRTVDAHDTAGCHPLIFANLSESLPCLWKWRCNGSDCLGMVILCLQVLPYLLTWSFCMRQRWLLAFDVP